MCDSLSGNWHKKNKIHEKKPKCRRCGNFQMFTQNKIVHAVCEGRGGRLVTLSEVADNRNVHKVFLCWKYYFLRRCKRVDYTRIVPSAFQQDDDTDALLVINHLIVFQIYGSPWQAEKSRTSISITVQRTMFVVMMDAVIQLSDFLSVFQLPEAVREATWATGEQGHN